MREPLEQLAGRRVLVTGAAGSIGTALINALRFELPVLETDRESMDVTRRTSIAAVFSDFDPEIVFHLAGAKHAPFGEEDPAEAAKINITGTRNILEAADKCGAHVVTASTCKACNPETAYGATKLIAERMTLNAGGSVARFYNVRESSGNVFSIWRSLPADAPLPVTPCKRRFMSIDQAVRLLLWAAILPPARYTVSGTRSRWMADVAQDLYPGRPLVSIPPRRGDRVEEPELAVQESALPVAPGISVVASVHDQVVCEAVAA